MCHKLINSINHCSMFTESKYASSASQDNSKCVIYMSYENSIFK